MAVAVVCGVAATISVSDRGWQVSAWQKLWRHTVTVVAKVIFVVVVTIAWVWVTRNRVC